MKKGFTLMEILAVLLVIAVLASFIAPAVRAVMAEIRYQQAKNAAVKMAEAIRVFYKDSKGYRISGDTTGLEMDDLDVSTNSNDTNSCNNQAISGIPAITPGQEDVSQLFYCNYLSAKDFSGLSNYKFNPGACTESADCLVQVNDKSEKHNKGCFRVMRDSSILEGVEGCD